MQNFIAIQSYRLKWTSLILKHFRVAHIKQFLDTSIAICLWTLPVATQWSYWHVNANTLIGAVILFSSLPYIYAMPRAHNTCTCAPTTNSHNIKWWQVPLEPSADVSKVAAAMISRSTSFASELHFKNEFLIANVHVRVCSLYPTVWYYLLLQQLI